MTSSESAQNPLRQLVVLMVCLSILGGALGGVLYYTIDLPKQKATEGQPPSNTAALPASYYLQNPAPAGTPSAGSGQVTL
jgi:hypothetical protein